MSDNPDALVIVTADAAFGRALLMSLETVTGIPANSYSAIEDAIRDIPIDAVVVLHPDSGARVHEWLWDKIRSDAPNPVIVIGIEADNNFLRQHPVFRQDALPLSHRYVRIEKALSGVLDGIETMSQVPDMEAARKDYSTHRAFVHSRLHRIKCSRNETPADDLRRFDCARELFENEGRPDIVAEIIRGQKEIESQAGEAWQAEDFRDSSPDALWERIARERKALVSLIPPEKRRIGGLDKLTHLLKSPKLFEAFDDYDAWWEEHFQRHDSDELFKRESHELWAKTKSLGCRDFSDLTPEEQNSIVRLNRLLLEQEFWRASPHGRWRRAAYDLKLRLDALMGYSV